MNSQDCLANLQIKKRILKKAAQAAFFNQVKSEYYFLKSNEPVERG